MIKRILTVLLLFPTLVCAQINTDRVMTIARNALYFEDYVLSIQYFNQVINAKPYLYEPYFFRALAFTASILLSFTVFRLRKQTVMRLSNAIRLW